MYRLWDLKSIQRVPWTFDCFLFGQKLCVCVCVCVCVRFFLCVCLCMFFEQECVQRQTTSALFAILDSIRYNFISQFIARGALWEQGIGHAGIHIFNGALYYIHMLVVTHATWKGNSDSGNWSASGLVITETTPQPPSNLLCLNIWTSKDLQTSDNSAGLMLSIIVAP